MGGGGGRSRTYDNADISRTVSAASFHLSTQPIELSAKLSTVVSAPKIGTKMS
jgi:hypothetical protein